MNQNYLMSYRRLRQSSHVRDLTRRVHLSETQFIQPLFVVEGLTDREPIKGLTGVYRETTNTLLKQIESDLEKGVKKFLLFGVPQGKATTHFNTQFTSSQIHEVKKRFGDDLWLSVDVCLCSYTLHGHCGVLNHELNHIQNNETVQELAKCALSYAQAGADCVAPSDMMDGRVAAIRRTLDQHGYEKTMIMSYSAKFHSKYYGPFRLAADSSPKTKDCKLKDRSSYQIDPANPKDAYLSSLRDANEGADILMVKPGLMYLDILSELSKKIELPWAVYEVSGEYASIELLASENLIDAKGAHIESWIAFVRAGASIIISYGARNAQYWLKG